MIQFVLLLWGLTYLLTSSAVFMPIRKIGMKIHLFIGVLLYCPACSGFWFGGILCLLGAWPLYPVLWEPIEAAISGCGMMAAISYFIPTASDAWELEQGSANDKTRQIQES